MLTRFKIFCKKQTKEKIYIPFLIDSSNIKTWQTRRSHQDVNKSVSPLSFTLLHTSMQLTFISTQPRFNQSTNITTVHCSKSQSKESPLPSFLTPNSRVQSVNMLLQSSVCMKGFRMPEALATRAIMQALMNVNVTVKAEVLLAFWTRYTRSWHVSCISTSQLKFQVRNASWQVRINWSIKGLRK